LPSIETAIAMKRDESQFYDSRAKIERAISGTTNESVVVQHLYEGYIQAGDIRVVHSRHAVRVPYSELERYVAALVDAVELDLHALARGRGGEGETFAIPAKDHA
jgi:hypothetical protein